MGMLDALANNPHIFDDIAKLAADNPDIAKAALSLLNPDNGTGGVDSIVNALQSGGLSDALSSWLDSGENLAVDPGQLESGG